MSNFPVNSPHLLAQSGAADRELFSYKTNVIDSGFDRRTSDLSAQTILFNILTVLGNVAVHDFDLAADVDKDVSVNHDISIADGVIFNLKKIINSATGISTFELQIGDGAAVEVFVTKAVVYGSTETPNPDIILDYPLKVTGTANTTTIRLVKTNRENQAQDLNSTIIGAS